MRKSRPWHHTPLGTVVLWLGSIELAVPVMVLTAGALAVSTYIESTADARLARETVYASWWFIALMALVCVSLAFAVASRIPWKRRHIGFITVHASLITMIIAGFWTMFGRVEGHIGLEEGTAGNAIETDEEMLELIEHQQGAFKTLASAVLPRRAAEVNLQGVPVRIVERWANSREETVVSDDGPAPFRAVQVSLGGHTSPAWVGESRDEGDAPVVSGLRIRVLPDGAGWEPTAPVEAGPHDYVFIVGGERIPLGEEGAEVIPGWRADSIRRLQRAIVSPTGLAESPSGADNPAVEVVISDGAGTTERHTAFLNFPDMVMGRTLSGSGSSGARLAPTGGGAERETLVLFGPIGATRVGYVGPDGSARIIEGTLSTPATLDLGSRQVTIHQHLSRARGWTRTVKATAGRENRPALLLRIGDATDLVVAPWKGLAPVGSPGRNHVVRYAPRTVTLPFSVRLVEFRKTDYPGTEMAMAYESDVAISSPGQEDIPFRIFMNNPYTHGAWKVYQSGFVGDHISIFSVTRDPGLGLTYIAATFLCIGIVVTFYSRSLSWGHPGIPAPASEKEERHAFQG